MKRLIAFLMLVAVFLSVPYAMAESTAYISDNILFVYASPNTSTRLLGKMGFGDKLTLMATSGIWARVRNSSGAVGYCLLSSLTGKNPNTDGRTVYVSQDSAKAYSLPQTGASVAGTAKRNTALTLLCISEDDTWCRVKNGSRIAYMKKSELSLTKSQSEITVYAAKDYLYAYQSMSASSKFLGKLPFGTKLTLLDATDSWAYVKNASGVKGYCRIDEITAVNPIGEKRTMYAASDGVFAYRSADMNADVVKTLSANEAVTAVGTAGEWTRVQLSGGVIAYVRTDALSTSITESEQSVYVGVYSMKAYKSASSASGLLGALPFGTTVTLLSQSGEWAYVMNGQGVKGYVSVSDLSWTNPNGAEKAYYAREDGAKVYASLSTGSKVLMRCGEGDQISVVAETPDGKWLRVKLSGGYGYAYWQDFTGREETENVQVYINAYSAKIYALADASSGLLGAMPFATAFTRLAETGAWTMLRNASGGVGYALSKDLTMTNPNTMELSMYAGKDGVKLYAAPGSANVLKTLSQNEPVTVTAKTADGIWMRVQYAGIYAYAKAEDFAENEVETQTQVYAAQAIVKAYALNSESAQIVGSVGYGMPLTALGGQLEGGWVKVKNEANDRIAYVKASGLTRTDPNTHNGEYYAQTTLKAYVLPDTESAVSMVFPINEPVKLTAVLPGNKWGRAKCGSVYVYVETSGLGKTKVPESDSGYTDAYKGTASAKIEKVIALAVAQFGKPYIYATEGPDSFDCSGLTMYAFKSGAGVSLHRSAQKQGYDERFTKIESVSALKRGDLICMNTIADNDLSDHVGIYLGGGKFIHASSGGEKVIVSSITSGYYNRVFSWALRIV